jgi:DNA-binding transcriptional MerR regulator
LALFSTLKGFAVEARLIIMKDLPKGPLLFKISEAAEMLGLESHVLRYWEKEFSAQVKPIKIGSRKKLYTRADVETFATIRDLMHVEGYSLSGAKKRLKEMGPRQNKLFQDPEEESGGGAPGARGAPGAPDATKPTDTVGEPGEPLAQGSEESVYKKLVGDIRLELLAIRDFLTAPKRPRPRRSPSEGKDPSKESLSDLPSGGDPREPDSPGGEDKTPKE